MIYAEMWNVIFREVDDISTQFCVFPICLFVGVVMYALSLSKCQKKSIHKENHLNEFTFG